MPVGENPIDSRQKGPEDASAAVHWAEEDVKSLQTQGLAVFEVDFAERFTEVLTSGVDLRTDYSGIGGAEEAFASIVKAARSKFGVPATACKVQRAGDILKQSRSILCSHVGVGAPDCVHGDLVDRMPQKVRNQVERLQRQHIVKAHQLIAKGMAKPAAYHEVGRQFVKKAAKRVFASATTSGSSLTAPCFKHCGSWCVVLPPPSTPESITGSTALG